MNKIDIVIVGMACVFPGISDPAQLWHNLVNGISYSSEDLDKGRSVVRHISSNQEEKPLSISLMSGPSQYSISFSPTHIGLSSDIFQLYRRDQIIELIMIDSALQDAGIAPDDEIRKRTDVIIGRSRYDEKLTINRRPLKDIGAPPNIFSERLNLFGKIKTIDGDCPSAIIGIEEAVVRLRQNLCDAAVVVGINLFHENSPDIGEARHTFSSQAAGTPNHCDAGLDLSDGAAAVILKRITDTNPENGQIYSIVKGIGISKERRSNAQALFENRLSALQSAYTSSGVDPDTIGYLEMHGHEVSNRDIDENETIRAFFSANSNRPTARPMGSLSPVIAHTLAAAGMASVIKTALCLTNKIIPPALGNEESQITIDNDSFYVNNKVKPWIHDSTLPPRRAAISAFGTDGTYAHIFLEELRAKDSEPAARKVQPDLTWETELVVFCGNTPGELKAKAGHLLRFLEQKHPTPHLKDIASTQANRFVYTAPCRLAMICEDIDQLKNYLILCCQRLDNDPIQFEDNNNVYFTAAASNNPGKIACLFPGLGVPGYSGVYLEGLEKLCVHFPQVRKVFDQIDLRNGGLKEPIPTSHIFFPPNHLPELEQKKLRRLLMIPRIDQEKTKSASYEHILPSASVIIASWATWALLRELDISVDMMGGFSVGELTAMCAAGSIDFNTAMPNWWQTPAEDSRAADRGQLAAVNATEEQIMPLLKSYRNISVVLYTSPQSHALGGSTDEIEHAVQELKDQGIWARTLPYPAIHTSRFSAAGSRILSNLETISVRQPNIPVYSGMTGEAYPHDEDAIKETLVAIVEQPIKFWQTIKKMYQDGARFFLQVGGNISLASQINSIINEEDFIALSMHEEHQPVLTQLNHVCASLLAHGATFNLRALFKNRSCKDFNYGTSNRHSGDLIIDTDSSGNISGKVPSSQKHENFISDDPSLRFSGSNDESRMPFISRIIQYQPDQKIVVEHILDLKEDLYLSHHLFSHVPGKPASACLPIMPMAFCLEMMAEAAACLAPGYGHIGFENVRSSQWIELKDVDTLVVKISARLLDENPDWLTRRVEVKISVPDQTMPAISAVVLFGNRYLLSVHLQFEKEANLRPFDMTAEQIYRQRHLFHGPLFHCLSDIISVGNRSVIGEVTVPSLNGLFNSIPHPEMITNPILLDCVGQVLIGLLIDRDWRPFPISIEKIEIYSPPPPAGTRVPVYLQVTHVSPKRLSVDYEVQNGSGMVWMRIKNWGFWIFNWSRRVIDFLRFPQKYFLCSENKLKLLPDRAVCQSISKEDLPDLKLEFIARIALGIDEMNTLFSFSENPRHQHHWLYGRLAAKDAVRLWLMRNNNIRSLHPAAFTIGNSNDSLAVEGLDDVPVPPQVSIAYSNDCAVAIAHEKLIGLDMAIIEGRESAVLDTFSTPRERVLLQKFPPSEYHRWETSLWCAKKAANKITGTDLNEQPLSFEATHMDDTGLITVIHQPTGRKIRVNTQKEGDFIIAFTIDADLPQLTGTIS